MADIDLFNAILFVDEHGSILEKARLLYLLMDVEPSTEVYERLLELQNPDGGFPSRPKAGSPSAVDSTLTSLWQLDELGMLDHPATRQAMTFLVNMQQADGSWDENPALPEHDLPPWIRPGEMATRLYLSAYSAYWLGVLHIAPETLDRALQYLLTQQDAQGKINGFLHNTWLGAGALLFGGHNYAKSAANCIAYLASRPFAEWEALQIAWAVDCLTRAGLDPKHSFVAQALSELVRTQQADGSWTAEGGQSAAASATVGVLKVLKRLTSLPPLA